MEGRVGPLGHGNIVHLAKGHHLAALQCLGLLRNAPLHQTFPQSLGCERVIVRNDF